MEERPGGSASREGATYPDVSRPPRVLNQPERLVGSTGKIINLTLPPGKPLNFPQWWPCLVEDFLLLSLPVVVCVCVPEGNSGCHLPCLFDLVSHEVLDSPMMLS